MRAPFLLLTLFVVSLFILSAGAWTADLSVTSGDTTIPLVIGVNTTATDGYDPGLDIPIPPTPPGSAFSAYLEGSGLFPMLQTNIRNTPDWLLLTEAEEPIRITWEAAPVPLIITIHQEVYQMAAPGEATLPAGSYQLHIQSSDVQEPGIPAYQAGGDPLPQVTATPLPRQPEPPATTAPLPSPAADHEPARTDSPDAHDSSNVTVEMSDEPFPSPIVPVPEESSISLLPVVGGVIIAGCLFWRYPRRKEL